MMDRVPCAASDRKAVSVNTPIDAAQSNPFAAAFSKKA